MASCRKARSRSRRYERHHSRSSWSAMTSSTTMSSRLVPLGPTALLRSREGWAAVTAVAEALQVQGELSGVEVAAVCRAAYGGREARHGTWHQHCPPTLEMLRSGFLPN